MTASLDKFLDFFSDYQIEIEDIASDKKPAVQQTYLMLLENPDERNIDILDQFLEREIVMSIEAHGNDELAAAFWGEVEDLASLSWGELNSFPKEDRDIVWSTARELVSAVSMFEALIREDFYVELLRLAVEDGGEVTDLAQKAGVKTLEKGFDVKTPINDKKKARKSNGV